MRINVIATAAFAAALISTGQALAAPPTNDAFADAATLSIPAAPTVDLTEATAEPNEPDGGCWPQARSAWYRVQPAADTVVRFASSGGPDRSLNVYRDNGSGLAGLSFLGCAYPWMDVVTTLQAGTAYYVQLGAPPWSGAGLVGLDVTVIDPPPNDDFVDALPVGGVPYSNAVEMRAATVEPGEPTQPPGVFTPFTRTAWYSFAATETKSVMVTANCCGFGHSIGVYTGSTVGTLTPVQAIRPFEQRVVFMAVAGTTYRIQDGVGTAQGGSGISIEATPMPSVGMWVNPPDPSIYDTTGFQANAWDPIGQGIDSYTWDFGDGSGATGPNATHRYALDGDYAVRLTVTTPDGRSAAATQTVAVRTRDVAIAKLGVPHSARTNQTKTITVGLANNRAAETVTVSLWRSRVGGGWDLVGQSTQFVPTKSGNKTTSFVFSYTFAPDDAAVGKVTFRAVASPQSGRDALPGDNEVIALPTSVSR
jgi:hypothetical protein